MHSDRAQGIRRVLLVAGGVVAATGGVLALVRGELTFVGRSTGRVATYTGASGISIALLCLGVAALLFARAATSNGPAQRVLFRCGVGLFVAAFAVQVYVALN